MRQRANEPAIVRFEALDHIAQGFEERHCPGVGTGARAGRRAQGAFDVPPPPVQPPQASDVVECGASFHRQYCGQKGRGDQRTRDTRQHDYLNHAAISRGVCIVT
jgi:hypothetical protein